VRHDLEGIILAYVEAAGIAGEAKDSPLFRASNGRSRKLSAKPLGTERICELVKRRLKDAGLPSRLSTVDLAGERGRWSNRSVGRGRAPKAAPGQAGQCLLTRQAWQQTAV
jgi:hypothetical protein